jgi:anti-anti-sigma factor
MSGYTLLMPTNKDVEINNSGSELERTLKKIQDSQGDVVIDMGRVTYILSPQINALVKTYEKLKDEKRRLVMFDVQKKVDEVFDICGIKSLIEVYAGIEGYTDSLRR